MIIPIVLLGIDDNEGVFLKDGKYLIIPSQNILTKDYEDIDDFSLFIGKTFNYNSNTEIAIAKKK